MKKTTFFTELIKSFSSLEYYTNSLKAQTNQALLWAFCVVGAVGLLQSALTAQRFLPKFTAELNETLQEAVKHYPEDLVITWENQSLSISQESLEIPLPRFLQEEYADSQENPLLLAVISSQEYTPQTVEPAKKALLFVNKNNVFIQSTEQSGAPQWEQFALRSLLGDLETVTITQESFIELANSLSEYFSANIVVVYALFILVGTFLFLFSQIWFVLFETAVLFLFLTLFNYGYTLKQIFTLSLRLIIPTSIFAALVYLIYPNSTLNMQLITFWVLVSIVLFSVANAKENQPTNT